MKKLLVFILSIFSCIHAFACTNIMIKAKDNSVLIGRTLEFGPSLETSVITSPRGKSFTTKTPNGHMGLSWKAKYGYLYLDYFKTKHPVDGMNEKGLSFAFLYMPGYTKFPPLDGKNDSSSLPYYHLGDWILGNFSTTAEVKNALRSIHIYNKPETVMGQANATFPIHVVVSDAQGNNIIIEFIDGQTKVYDDPVGTLTNAPSFPWQMNNLKNYSNLTPYAPAPIKVDGYVYAGTGQGSGSVGLPGDATPPSRFVKVTFLTQYAAPSNNAKEALTMARHILNTVDLPNGFVRGQKGENTPNDTTQWTVYKDLTNRILYFTSYHNSELHAIDLNKLDFSENAPQRSMPVASNQEIKDVTGQLK